MSYIKVSYQGMPGAFSDIAAKKYFKNKAKTCPRHTFKDLFEAVKNKQCHFAMVPIENSIAGSIYQNYDLLAKYNLYIKGEIYLKISHNLLVIPIKNVTGIKRLRMVKRVYSHPVALAQCRMFFQKYPWMKAISAEDTAGSAKDLADSGKKDSAAIASAEAGEIYHLEVLQKEIETNKKNFTRFVLVGRKANIVDAKINKASLVFSLIHKPGSLYKSLKPFAQRNINLTRIESRPIIGKPWHYLFYLDFEINSIKKCRQAIKELKRNSLYLKILGFY